MKADIAALLLRVYFGGAMLLAHGLPKIQSFSEKSGTFSDPLGLGPQLSLILVIFAEFFCSAAVVAGFLTRFACIPLAFTMFVAGIIVHGSDPWNKKALALSYMIVFLSLILTGPGRFSVDAILKRTGLLTSRWS